ncbi:MAG: hypothetical protein A2287_08610 [Candidatus Melainabacteria bacterium RIFOXYA12_FULL_32_12]|nr:MAG: hypothetical protein A2255_01315 [Candidatus Melainabacteria bacterium RIFOXYA2_FULL_32_9]OGI30442.1 MAG: hypothetical protein A2287_08610 [Candidatus Melainabacteria bacterium RIFOXYA12_FULL_32_12]
MHVVKICSNASAQGCFHQNWLKLNGDESIGDGIPGFILNDGTLVRIYWNVAHGGIIYDVNGFKKPNTVGKDIFRLMIRVNILEYGEGTDCSTTGWGCLKNLLLGEDYY